MYVIDRSPRPTATTWLKSECLSCSFDSADCSSGRSVRCAHIRTLHKNGHLLWAQKRAFGACQEAQQGIKNKSQLTREEAEASSACARETHRTQIQESKFTPCLRVPNCLKGACHDWPQDRKGVGDDLPCVASRRLFRHPHPKPRNPQETGPQKSRQHARQIMRYHPG